MILGGLDDDLLSDARFDLRSVVAIESSCRLSLRSSFCNVELRIRCDIDEVGSSVCGV